MWWKDAPSSRSETLSKVLANSVSFWGQWEIDRVCFGYSKVEYMLLEK